MSVLCLDPLIQYSDNDGNPLAGGFLYTYDALTLDPRAVYTDTDGATPHENPVELDSSGRPPSPIFYTRGAAYNLILKDAEDVTIDTVVSIEIPDDLVGEDDEEEAASAYYDIEFFKGGTPTEGELIYGVSVGHAAAWAANWAGSVGLSPTVPPASSFVITIKKNGTTVGTATCSTIGTWTFATTGGATVSAIVNDEFKFYGPATLSTIEDLGITLVGTVA
jgi:hypothetical protein